MTLSRFRVMDLFRCATISILVVERSWKRELQIRDAILVALNHVRVEDFEVGARTKGADGADCLLKDLRSRRIDVVDLHTNPEPRRGARSECGFERRVNRDGHVRDSRDRDVDRFLAPTEKDRLTRAA